MPGTVHIIAQTQWHSPAIIVGDVAGLTAVRDALTRAIESGDGKAATFARDGEGYSVVALCREDMDGVPFGYTDPTADSGGLWPRWFVHAITKAGRA